MARSRYRFGDARQPHFITSTVVAWLPIFTRPAAVQIVLESQSGEARPSREQAGPLDFLTGAGEDSDSSHWSKTESKE